MIAVEICEDRFMAVNCVKTGATVGRKGARFSGTLALYFLFSRNRQGWRFAHLAG
jgi:hypothetical protein